MIRCVSCGEEYEDDEVIYNCKKCGSVLEVEVEVDVPKSTFEGRRDNLWKYKECLPVDASKRVSLDEGGTPFCKCDKLGKELGLDLYVKIEGSNP
ncbi:MAG: threonine synthase, partial [Methanosphaera sp.]|nr:threonine synthase [Methanosphaera sp.]